MFESAELGHAIDKATYREAETRLREALLAAQYELKQRGDFPVIIVLAGMPAAGKGELANLLAEWMDPRNISTLAFDPPNDEEASRPPFWRFWRVLPAKGNIGIVFGSWYADPLWHWDNDHHHAEIEQRVERIVRLEKLLTDDGALVLKFWLHLSEDRLKKRLKSLQADPLTAWRVSKEDKTFLKHYDANARHAKKLLARTNQAESSWRVVEGWDANYRALSVGQQLLEAIEHHLARDTVKQRRADAAPLQPSIDGVRLLDTLQLDHPADKHYKQQLEALQGRLNGLVRDPRFARHAVVAVFEGMDAAGKGGAIRRITAALDARQYRVVPIAAPTDEEKAQPYLWRFWRQVPARGRLTIFDRSWYGRVLVERVEGFASNAEWLRAYGEINDFEAQLDHAGVIVVKFWLSISKEEQLARFNAREATGWKRFKITDDDWRNREKWDDYVVAGSDMIERTSTTTAPWHLIGANNKQHARIAVLEALCAAIESRFKRKD
ncbi:Thymidylate kinase [Andreprevotia sp. IGB-42]|uniref:polyphosphate:AMP phosphotransferase n=1 Tax=Andreprevotia sp. IGB-42 TaxID=2497473 RepID=UPI00135A5D03|nr:polyphosphate:AMP phosphotransferase [Andreprevotia sp. IGB-42]KAF0812744.1 Thymidylate kinase [Andreprevotia sp. IGB-42]